ncbi:MULTISPECIES: PilZ domain-containing protein [Vibrio]|uniref:Flagellar protein YcgR n=1 Tax=Vibrio crassostreae TaxID=246167 RepID=A0ABP1WWA5_9VIBR|nr:MULTISPECIES: PilZ domain-containing protein [Vibrio]MCK8085523.1 flagellar brake protein [Vibrio sp. 1CM8B]ROS66487.1 flagellar protein YcgR [Vibrio crassostreae]RPF14922.1 flagellar protein YcgR [Vibrio crassostreae]TCL21726.1 flagellar protein YcgR [Vibrio crassostreae]TCT41691.1 flagellar protein YcgR [Vibrio crassostreae]
MHKDKNLELFRYLKPGTKTAGVLEFGPDDSIQISTLYIGHKEDQYLILELTQKATEALTLRKLTNVDIIVRAITDTELGHIVAFKTNVLAHITSPAHLIFLRPPSNFATKPIREHERYKVRLSCEVTFDTLSLDATLIDFSASGCGIYLTQQSDIDVGWKIKVNSDLNEFLDDDLVYKVVSKKRQRQGWLLGVQFPEHLDMSDELKTLLLEQAFVAGSI